MSALIAYEPTQDSEVLADTVENDGSGFWNPNLYICVPKSGAILLGMRFPSTSTVVLITLDGDESGRAESRQFFLGLPGRILALCRPVLEQVYKDEKHGQRFTQTQNG